MIIPLKSRYIQLNEEEFFYFCQEMKDFRIERKADGTILIMSPAGSESSNLNIEVSTEVTIWNRQTKLGFAFDSSGGFTMPDTAVLSPDTSWIKKERWLSLDPKVRKKFAPIVPDFVIEIKSESDAIEDLKDKMQSFRGYGVRLGWLINPQNEEVWIYRPLGNPERQKSFTIPLSGEDVLPGFELRLADII
ncbi:MAG: Uma2 family endonuclease [Bacteroidota bacterium]